MSKVQFHFDKKQLPQIIALGVLSVCMLGYFTVRMLTPPPTERALASTSVGPTAVKNPVMSQAAIEMESLTNGTAPTPQMLDPFISAAIPVVSTATEKPLVVSANVNRSVPNSDQIQPLPISSAIKPLSGLTPGGTAAPVTAPAAAPWTVTGVLVEGDSYTAILRNGEARRFVSLGEMVDDQYRLVGIDRFGVTLALGANHIRLNLGASNPKPSSDTPSAINPTPDVPSSATVNELTKQLNSGTIPPVTLN